jgi:hypothetical protein
VTPARKGARQQRTAGSTTHEQYVHRTREAVIAIALAQDKITSEQATPLQRAKLLYGVGDGTYRGICHYDAWDAGSRVDVVEIAATAQESWVQLAGTVVHELGHVLAGWEAGHGADWKAATQQLGFQVAPDAAGQVYRLAMFHPHLRHAIYTAAGEIGDGHPDFNRFATLIGALGGTVTKPRPCSAGVGTRGGKSRGKGSGSRMRLWECACAPKPVKVRVASDDFAAHCDHCGSAFTRANTSPG